MRISSLEFSYCRFFHYSSEYPDGISNTSCGPKKFQLCLSVPYALACSFTCHFPSEKHPIAFPGVDFCLPSSVSLFPTSCNLWMHGKHRLLFRTFACIIIYCVLYCAHYFPENGLKCFLEYFVLVILYRLSFFRAMRPRFFLKKHNYFYLVLI